MNKEASCNTKLMFLLILLCIPFFPPEGLGFTSAVNVLVWFRRIQTCEVCALIIYECYDKFIHIHSYRKNKKEWNMFLLVSSLAVMQILCTVINSGSIYIAVQRVQLLVGVYIIVERFILKYPYTSLVTLTYVFLAVLIINFIIIIALYDSMGFRIAGRVGGDFWLFGQKNTMRNITIPALAFSAVLDRLNKKKISARTIFLIVIGIVSLYLVDSSSSLVVTAMFIFLLIFLCVTNYEIINLKLISIFYVILEILMVFLRKINIFSWIIEGVLGGDVTLTNRTYIWDIAIGLIGDKLWLGEGLRELEDSNLVIGSFHASHAHNALLDIMLKCGIIGAVLLIIIVVLSIRQLLKQKGSALGAVFGMALGSFLIVGIVGELWNFGFFLILFCGYYLQEIIDRIKITDNKYIRKQYIRFRI